MSELQRAVLLVEFPLGRYHATPWAAHVNEGRVEFPPSLWRLLRALYATWRERVPDLDADLVQRLLGALATPPSYYVPPFLVAHTRHYYPQAITRPGDSTPGRQPFRTLDAFAAVDPRVPLAVVWPEPLPDEEAKAFARLAEAMPYLGRADSVCRAWVEPSWSAPAASRYVRWEPIGDAAETEEGAGEISGGVGRLLCPDLRHDVPLDIDALIERPVELRALRRLRFPRSSRYVSYREVRQSVSPPQRRATRKAESAEGAVVRFKVTDSVLPLLADTLKVTEGFHAAAASRLNRIRGDERRCSLLLGIDELGEPLRRDHQHAHFLAMPDAERPSAIGELLIWSPAGLEADEVAALAQITSIRVGDRARKNPGAPDDDAPRDPRRTLGVRMSGYGDRSLLPDALIGERQRRDAGFVRWRSLTPYVATGHPRRDREAYLRERFVRDASQAGVTLPPLAAPLDFGSAATAAAFERRRFAHRIRGGFMPAAACVTAEFTAPVVGPLSVGALTHFGLGLFAPVVD